MGGFTKIQLKDVSQENIDLQNSKLDIIGLRKKIRFYSKKDIALEYEYFKKDDGVFNENFFPRNLIHSLSDFKRYWSTEALGEVFVPPIGSLTFDCYFGRTSKRAMHHIGLYLVDNHKEIKSASGSYSVFIERAGLNELELLILEKANKLDNF